MIPLIDVVLFPNAFSITLFQSIVFGLGVDNEEVVLTFGVHKIGIQIALLNSKEKICHAMQNPKSK